MCVCVYVDLVAHDALLICKAFFFYVDVVFVHCQKYERTFSDERTTKGVGGQGGFSTASVRILSVESPFQYLIFLL